MRLRRPGATTYYGDMRGSTLLLHRCEATHSTQLQSALHLLETADLTPAIGSLLPTQATPLSHRWRFVLFVVEYNTCFRHC